MNTTLAKTKIISNDEAAQLLTKALEQFKDVDGKIDVVLAAAIIFENPLVIENPKIWRWQLKIVENAISHPTACYHHYRLWEWLGLRRTLAFEQSEG